MTKIRRGFLLLLVLTLGGCRGCFCTNAAKSMGEKPPDDVVLAGAKKGLGPAILKTLCGVRVAALQDPQLALVEETSGHQRKVRVSGLAIPYDGGATATATADEDDAGIDDEDDDDASAPDASAPDASAKVVVIAVEPAKALVCTGVVVVTVTAVLARDGTRKDWSTSVAVDSVETPGVKFEKEKPSAPSSGGHRRHRRHHH